MTEPETVEVVFVHHHTDRTGPEIVHRAPEEKASFPIEEARRLVKGRVAVFATKTGAKAAGMETGPTARDPQPEPAPAP